MSPSRTDRTRTGEGRAAELRPGSAAARILDQLEMWGQKLGLDRIRSTLEALGRPDRSFPVILVGGTNGKGTTAALLSSILSRAGYRCGLFTSPHLESVRERIRVDGRTIAADDLACRLEEVVAASGRTSPVLPTYFEAMTAAALVHFRSTSVDVAVLEVGLGGRLDATNATEPLLSVVTSIAHDHEEHLGRRLDQITREKLGIARRDRPLLAWAPRQRGVQLALADAAAEGVAVDEVWRSVTVVEDDPATHAILLRSSGAPGSDTEPMEYRLRPRIAGAHQHGNLALAVRAAEHLARGPFPGLDRDAIGEGIARCRWPGRLERVRVVRGARADGSVADLEVLLDGAHNLAGARALARFLERKQESGEEPYDVIFGALRGKKAVRCLRELEPRVGRILLTAPVSHRALPVTDLERALRRWAPTLARRCEVAGELDETMHRIVQESRRLLVCGSLYLVGDARRWLTDRFGRPQPAAELDLFEIDD